MKKFAVLALGLFAGLVSVSSSFAAEQVDLIISAARLNPSHVAVDILNRGRTEAKACNSKVRVVLQGRTIQVELACAVLAAGAKKTLLFQLPQDLTAELQRLRFERITNPRGYYPMAFVQAEIDTRNEVFEKFSLAVAGTSIEVDGEVNNTYAFATLP